MTGKKTPTRAALKLASRLHPLVKDGLAALQKVDRGYVHPDVKSTFEDSLALDAAMEAQNAQSHRWDYLLGHATSGAVVGLEPHSASDKEVSVVIAKRFAAKTQLREHLNEGMQVERWLWVASGKVGFTQMERATKQLDQNGIEFVGKCVMAKHLPTARKKG